MSLESIINLTISAKSVHIGQRGFGVPLLVGRHTQWPERVRTYASVDALLADGFASDCRLVRMAEVLMAQNPGIKLFKIGRREDADVTADLRSISECDNDFYGFLLDSSEPDQIVAAAEWAETKRVIFGVDVHDWEVAAQLKTKGERLSHTFGVFQKKEDNFVAAALMAKMLAHKPGSSSWAFKSLAKVTPTSFSDNEITKLDAHNINRYTSIKNVSVSLPGKAVSGEYLDVVCGLDWLYARIQERLFALLLKNPKIPYTNQGVDLVRCEIMAQLKEAIHAGILAPEPEPVVSAPDVADISDANKAQRVLPDVSFSGTLSGAIHAITINGTVSL